MVIFFQNIQQFWCFFLQNFKSKLPSVHNIFSFVNSLWIMKNWTFPNVILISYSDFRKYFIFCWQIIFIIKEIDFRYFDPYTHHWKKVTFVCTLHNLYLMIKIDRNDSKLSRIYVVSVEVSLKTSPAGGGIPVVIALEDARFDARMISSFSDWIQWQVKVQSSISLNNID